MSILDEIVAQKRRELSQLSNATVTEATLREAVQRFGPRRNFLQALRSPRRPGPALIAEVKKASPSAGVICPDFDHVAIAKSYQQAGASCLSVLTDEKFFQGSLRYLSEIRAAVDLPLLRKDFMIDPRQVVQAIEHGADAILLIAAILSRDEMQKLHDLALVAGLSVLVEVHDREELDTVLQMSPRPELIGVNNRNLKTFKVDLATTEELAAELERHAKGKHLLVAESGLHSRADVERVQACGAKAVLVGESLMRDRNKIAEKINALLPTA
jgi:indole-3-glycerol phosphate synthase